MSISPFCLPGIPGVECLDVLILENKLICHRGNKLGICRLSTFPVNHVAKICIEDFHIASVPCNLNGMPDGTLHTALCRIIRLSDIRIQNLRHIFNDFRFFYSPDNCRSEIPIPFDMRRNSNLTQDIRYSECEITIRRCTLHICFSRIRLRRCTLFELFFKLIRHFADLILHLPQDLNHVVHSLYTPCKIFAKLLLDHFLLYYILHKMSIFGYFKKTGKKEPGPFFPTFFCIILLIHIF